MQSLQYNPDASTRATADPEGSLSGMALSYTWDLAGDSSACTARLRTCLQVAGYGVHHVGLVDKIELHADLLCQLVHRRHQIEFELCVLLPAHLTAGGARHMCLTQLTAGQVRACGRDRLAIRVALLASYRHYFLHYKELKACDRSLAVCTSLQACCTRYRLLASPGTPHPKPFRACMARVLHDTDGNVPAGIQQPAECWPGPGAWCPERQGTAPSRPHP